MFRFSWCEKKSNSLLIPPIALDHWKCSQIHIFLLNASFISKWDFLNDFTVSIEIFLLMIHEHGHLTIYTKKNNFIWLKYEECSDERLFEVELKVSTPQLIFRSYVIFHYFFSWIFFTIIIAVAVHKRDIFIFPFLVCQFLSFDYNLSVLFFLSQSHPNKWEK